MPEDARPAKSSTQRAADELRALIFRGDLPAGSDHLESELAIRLNMSRTPVREATLMLQAQGLLDIRPRRGVRILAVSPEDMNEVYEVLTELESLAAARAAQAGYSEADLADLAGAIEAMEAALAVDDRDAWAEADERFHAELVRLGGNNRAAEIVARMGDQVRRARAVTLYIRPLPMQSNADHRSVLDAIRAGDSEIARTIHRKHRTDARRMLTDLLERHRLRNL